MVDSHNNKITDSYITNNGEGLDLGALYMASSDGNTFYNNFFNNSVNIQFEDSGFANTWNTALDCVTPNIIGGTCTGGNFWATPAADGFSETCATETEGICDITNPLDADNIDNLALVYEIPPSEIIDNPPNVTLNAPENDNISSTQEIIFNCSAEDDYALASITLYGNWSGIWHANETIALMGTTNSTLFIKILDDGTYQWNCLATDNSSNSSWYETNYTLTIDATAPIITSVTNTSITNMSAVITWTTDENSNSRVDFGTTVDLITGFNSTETPKTSHSITLNNLINNTVYYYNVTSCDSLGNCNHNGPYDFSTSIYNPDNTPPVVQQTTSGSSGGGSGGARITPALDANTSQKSWYTLVSNSQVVWNINKSTVTALEIQTGKQSSNAALLVKELNQKPLFLPDAGEVYKYLNITPTNMNVKETAILFKVEKSWINDREVVLKRYTTEWTELPTQETSHDAKYTFYKATTSGFSYFAVTAKEKEVIPEPQSSTPAESAPEIKSQEQPETNQTDITPSENMVISENRSNSDTIFGIIILVLAAIAVIGLIVKFYPRIRNL